MREYIAIVLQSFITSEPKCPDMGRIAIELAEELLEYLTATSQDQSLDELADLYYWYTYLSQQYILPEPIPTELEPAVLAIIGRIKRYYRDGTPLDLAQPIANLGYAISQANYGNTLDLMLRNYAKIARRLANNTIQGKGDR